MGWLRVMRPGSVIGEQQGFLCRVQRIREAQAAKRRTGLASAAFSSSCSSSGRLGGLTDRGGPSAAQISLALSKALRRAASDSALEDPPPSAAAAAAAQVSDALGRQSAARARAARGLETRTHSV